MNYYFNMSRGDFQLRKGLTQRLPEPPYRLMRRASARCPFAGSAIVVQGLLPQLTVQGMVR